MSRLVLLGAAPAVLCTHPELRQAKEDAIKSLLSDQAAFDEGFIKKAFHAAPSPELLQFLVNIGTSASSRGSVTGLEELRDRDLRAEMESVAIPP